MGQLALFGNHIVPACEYCAHSIRMTDEKTLQCPSFGAVTPQQHCEQFLYAPLRRIPRRTPKLPDFSAEDFKL